MRSTNLRLLYTHPAEQLVGLIFMPTLCVILRRYGANVLNLNKELTAHLLINLELTFDRVPNFDTAEYFCTELSTAIVHNRETLMCVKYLSQVGVS